MVKILLKSITTNTTPGQHVDPVEEWIKVKKGILLSEIMTWNCGSVTISTVCSPEQRPSYLRKIDFQIPVYIPVFTRNLFRRLNVGSGYTYFTYAQIIYVIFSSMTKIHNNLSSWQNSTNCGKDRCISHAFFKLTNWFFVSYVGGKKDTFT